MLTKTLAQLRSDVLVQAGMNTTGTSVDLTPTVLNGIVNSAIIEGWDVITQKWSDYHTAMATVSVVADSDTYPLPDDFYKHRVLWILEGSEYKRLTSVSLDEAHRYTRGTSSRYRYRLTNRNLVLMPVPSGSESLRVFYIPNATELVADDDEVTFDVPIEHKYIIAIAWRDVLERQNLDPSPAIAKMQGYEAKLRTAADGLDSEPFYLDGGRHADDWEDV